MKEHLTSKLKMAPNEPGVYQFFNSKNKIIYIGKAKNIKNRVRSYFQNNKNKSSKTEFSAQKQKVKNLQHFFAAKKSKIQYTKQKKTPPGRRRERVSFWRQEPPLYRHHLLVRWP